MNATSRPPRRRKSALAGEHPAWPTGAPEPPPQAPETPPEPAPEPPAPEPAAVIPEQQTPAEREPPSRAYARTRVRAPEPPRPRAGTPAEARARKLARDAAFGYAAAARKADRRLGEWAEAMTRARELGTAPAVLRGYITEAAEKADVPESAIPDEVWAAAGIKRADR